MLQQTFLTPIFEFQACWFCSVRKRRDVY